MQWRTDVSVTFGHQPPACVWILSLLPCALQKLRALSSSIKFRREEQFPSTDYTNVTLLAGKHEESEAALQ